MWQRDTGTLQSDNERRQQHIQAMLDQLSMETKCATIRGEITASQASLFETHFQQYHRSLIASTYNLLGSPEAVQDIAQDTWLALLLELQRKPLSWFEHANIPAWLRETAKNKALNYEKKQQRLTSLNAEKTAFVFEPHVPPFDYPEHTTMRAEVCDALYQAVKTLRTPQRQVIALRFFYDLSLGDIAQALALHLNTVKAHQRRGLLQLKKVLCGLGVEHSDLSFWTQFEDENVQRKNLFSRTTPPGD